MLHDWALRWGVPMAALEDLARMTGQSSEPLPDACAMGASEGAVQSRVRLEASRQGIKAFRNNVGVLFDDTGRPVRYGLANDSPAINKVYKSSDLVGIRSVRVTAQMVGHVLGVFWCREVKHEGWRYSGNGREAAQFAWMMLILAMGGDAGFATNERDV